jgi:hypothetical protein
MNKFLVFTVSLCCIRAVFSLCCPDPASAQGPQKGLASGYGTGETIQVEGWERDLVSRNKGLEQFHWSPRTTVRRYRTVAAGAALPQAPSGQSAYQNAKPKVVSRWSGAKGTEAERQAASGVYIASRATGNVHFLNPNPSSYWQIGRGYETKPYNYKPSPYGANADHQVSARVMHY